MADTIEAAAATPASHGTAAPRRADPAPTIGLVRRKSVVLEVAKSDLKTSLQASQSSQQQSSQQLAPRSSSHVTSVSSPAEQRSNSVASFTPSSSAPPTQSMEIPDTLRSPSAPAAQALHPPPRSAVTAGRGTRSRSTPTLLDGELLPPQQTSTPEVNAMLATPTHSPKLGYATPGAAAVVVASPPPPCRPTAAPTLEGRGGSVVSNVSAPSSPAAAAANTPLQRRSTSPRATPRSASSSLRKTPGEGPRLSLTVTPLSTSDLGTVDHGGGGGNGARAAVAAAPRRSVSGPGVHLPAVTAGGAEATAGAAHRFASVIHADVDVDSEGCSVPAQSAPTPTAHRSPSNRSTRGARSVGDRSRSPVPENIAALLEDLQELRQREAAEARRADGARAGGTNSEASHDTEAQRSHKKAVAAVKGRGAADTDSMTTGATGADDSCIVDESLSTFLFPVETGADDRPQPRPSRATDTTGHAPVTPRLRRRIEEEQQREFELLRTITKERHPENVELLDSPERLMRGLGCIDADMDPAEAEEALRSLSAEDDDTLIASRPPPPEQQQQQEKHGDAAKPAQRASSAAVVKPTRAGEPTKPPRKPPLRGDDAPSVASSESTTSRGVTKPRETSRSQRLSSTARSDVSSARKTASRALSSSFTSAPTPSAAAATAVYGAQRPSPSRGRQSTAAESTNNSSGSAAKFTRRASKTTAGAGAGSDSPSSPMTGAATRGPSTPTTATASAAHEGTERRHRPAPDHAGTTSAAGTPSAAAGEHGPRPLQRHSSTAGHTGESTSPTEKAAGLEPLLPALISPEESERTITIVFDLDETLCNNRCLGGALLRPGAELLLHTLRSLAPSPRYKLVDTRTRAQHATARLYDQAMFRMGMTPLYRPRVAQRQATSGFHANVVGGSTGEARPATTKETHPLRIELVLWTASEESLARRAMRRLDPQNAIFDEAIYRDLRWYRDSYYTKELSRLGRSMQRVVIIENSVESVIRNRQNAVLVTSFITNRMDRQLFLVREVLRDWTRGMKAYLAYQLEQQAQRADAAAVAAEEGKEQEKPPLPSGVELTDSSCQVMGGATQAEGEEGGESPVPPYSTSSPTERATSVTNDGAGGAEDEEPVPQSNAPAPTPKVGATGAAAAAPASSSGPDTSSASLTLPSSSSPPSQPRVLTAAAQRAANIVQFLHRHRLILPESNYINFQMTGEVMLRLQSTETAIIAAALPPTAAAAAAASADSPATRTVRSSGCGPAPRSPRTPARPPVPSPAAVSAAAAGESTPPVNGAAAASTPQSSGRPRSAAAAAAEAPATIGRTAAQAGSAGNASNSAAAAAAPVAKATAAVRSDAPTEVKRALSLAAQPPPATTAAGGGANTTSARAARQQRPASANADASASDKGVDRPSVRPARTPSAAAKRPVT